ncbi:MAG TPA: hypothetical protein DCK95_07950 [Anaerolineaceae bacterium]|uniref:Peptidase M28 n=1 Tax=Anaerolinea thermophila TaxID=167964 RepID=A0A101FYP1_9CHLR|nr:MAG: Peptidase M28 [Anaerolinea thermophila]HAF62243.1 hypothetical protein [Anaerolineaceae bacterium]
MRFMNRFFVIVILLAILTGCSASSTEKVFSGEKAYNHVQTQLGFGARIPGSKAIQETASYITSTLQDNSWSTQAQSFEYGGVALQNIIAKKGNGENIFIIATHYDTRAKADRDVDSAFQKYPVPGANDGASGTAVLLELSRVLAVSDDAQVWLVFFDGEDQGHLDGWEWSIGADYFVEHLTQNPHKVVIIDMIGDAKLNVFQEKNSTPDLVEEIWTAAEELDYLSYFIPEEKYTMIDDHVPFLNHGIPAVLLIDFDYDFWHTTQDTIENISADSLQIVGNLLCHWLQSTQ